MDCSMPGFLSFTICQSLLKLMSIRLVMPSNHLIYCRLLLPPSVFPASRSFPRSQVFASGGQSIGASASASVLSMNIQYWFPLGLTGLISLQSKGPWTVEFPAVATQNHLNWLWICRVGQKVLLGFSINILWKKPNELFGQPNNFCSHLLQYKKLPCLNGRFVYVQSRKWRRWSYLRSRSGDTAIENTCVDTKEELELTYIP